MRWRCLALPAVAAAGCQTLLAPVPHPAPAETAAVAAELDVETDALALAAKALDRGDDAGAVPHLQAVVKAHPDQVLFRANLAEALLKVGRADEARDHFERYVAAVQGTTGPAERHRVHCHTRLMEIARDGGDRGGELFHKGVGLLLLSADADAEDEAFGEVALCQAARALEEAGRQRPGNARVNLYLGDAYARMGNRRAAGRAWAAARDAVPGALTPTERERLATLAE